MKVTNDDVIKSGEQELIDGITAELDWEAVETLFREQHRLPLGEDVSYRNGDIVVDNGRIAYLLEFEVKVPLALLVDRLGNCIGIRADAPPENAEEGAEAEEAPSAEGAFHDKGRAPSGPGDAEGEEQVGLRVSEALAEIAELEGPADVQGELS